MSIRLVLAAAFLITSSNVLPAHSHTRWGCYARNAAGDYALSWNDSTKKAARKEALYNCRFGGKTRCQIVSCSANAATQDQAEALWHVTVKCRTNCVLPSDRR
jgi:hypothetical protein